MSVGSVAAGPVAVARAQKRHGMAGEGTPTMFPMDEGAGADGQGGSHAPHRATGAEGRAGAAMHMHMDLDVLLTDTPSSDAPTPSDTDTGTGAVLSSRSSGAQDPGASKIKKEAVVDRCGIALSEPCDDAGHGTHVASLAVGDFGIGMAPGAKWQACRGLTKTLGREEDVLGCLNFFLAPTNLGGHSARPDLRPHVINNSYGWGLWSDAVDAGIDLAVKRLEAAGTLMVFAAGNSGPECGSCHSNFSFVVGSVDDTGIVSRFSARGPFTNFGTLPPRGFSQCSSTGHGHGPGHGPSYPVGQDPANDGDDADYGTDPEYGSTGDENFSSSRDTVDDLLGSEAWPEAFFVARQFVFDHGDHSADRFGIGCSALQPIKLRQGRPVAHQREA